jgi:hypothetical protein
MYRLWRYAMIKAMWEATKILWFIIMVGSLVSIAVFAALYVLLTALFFSAILGIAVGIVYLWIALTALHMWGMG